MTIQETNPVTKQQSTCVDKVQGERYVVSILLQEVRELMATQTLLKFFLFNLPGGFLNYLIILLYLSQN